MVQQAVGKLVAGKTVLVIAHRLSTITGADQIVVVNGGRSQDVGTHGELLKNCPLYQEMWRDEYKRQALGSGIYSSRDPSERGSELAVCHSPKAIGMDHT